MKAGALLAFAQFAFSAGRGPCAGHAETKVGVLHGIDARPAKVVFDMELGLAKSFPLTSSPCLVKWGS